MFNVARGRSFDGSDLGSLPMIIIRFLVVLFALEVALATTALAKTKSTQASVVAAQYDAQVQRPVFIGRSGIILRQDLFDRRNPNNIRTNWPAPPAQPGRY